MDIVYKTTLQSIKKAKGKTWRTVGVVWGAILLFVGVLIIIGTISSEKSEQENIARLEMIEDEIKLALEKEDFKYALMNADILIYPEYDTFLVKEWEVRRGCWIDVVIEKALDNGIVLENPDNKKEEQGIEKYIEDNYKTNNDYNNHDEEGKEDK